MGLHASYFAATAQGLLRTSLVLDLFAVSHQHGWALDPVTLQRERRLVDALQQNGYEVRNYEELRTIRPGVDRFRESMDEVMRRLEVNKWPVANAANAVNGSSGPSGSNDTDMVE